MDNEIAEARTEGRGGEGGKGGEGRGGEGAGGEGREGKGREGSQSGTSLLILTNFWIILSSDNATLSELIGIPSPSVCVSTCLISLPTESPKREKSIPSSNSYTTK